MVYVDWEAYECGRQKDIKDDNKSTIVDRNNPTGNIHESLGATGTCPALRGATWASTSF